MSNSVLPGPRTNAAVADASTELETALAAGLDDIDAGRIVSADESRREVEAMFAKFEATKSRRP